MSATRFNLAPTRIYASTQREIKRSFKKFTAQDLIERFDAGNALVSQAASPAAVDRAHELVRQVNDDTARGEAAGELIDALIKEKYEEGLTIEQFAQIDFISQEIHRVRPTWTSFKHSDGDSSRQSEFRGNPKKLGSVINDNLRDLGWCCYVYTELVGNESLWLGVYYYRTGAVTKVPTDAASTLYKAYLLWYPDTELIHWYGAKIIRGPVFQALLNALGCTQITAIDVKGKNPHEMAVFSLNSMAHAADGARDANPLKRGWDSVLADIDGKAPQEHGREVAHEKRVAMNEAEDRVASHVPGGAAIVAEDRDALEKRHGETDEVFGVVGEECEPAPLPALDVVTFNLASDFIYEKNNVPLTMTVRLEGPSVLSGLREMVHEGLISGSLPPHLQSLPSAGTTTINLNQVRETEEEARSGAEQEE